MRYPTSRENIVRTAALTATGVVASSAFELISRDAEGGGTVDLSGSYSGADDALIDIEITSNTINGVPQISTPVFSGVGNGQISGISADSGIAAQQFTVTVADLGTPTRAAFAPFQSGNLVARAAGPDGNDLSVRISQAGLTATATNYAVTRELTADGEEFTGEEFNFGAVSIEPEGTVPANAARLRFGDDICVYRHWREFRDRAYRYHFSPAIQRTVPVGTRVYAITGGRTATVFDGATELASYTDITSLYSLVSPLHASSAVIDYDGVITQDRRPGGMACDDLSVYTASYSAGSVREGSVYIRRAVVPLTVPASAPTEALRIECIAAPIPGAEIWQLSGSVSDNLGTFTTGEAFSAGGYTVTVPVELQATTEPVGDRAAYLNLLDRGEGENIPSLCVRNFRLGIEAQTRTYVFEWRPHPGAECDCRSVSVSGGPIDDFLGIEEGGTAVATLPAAIKTRMQTVADWRKSSLGSNVLFDDGESLRQSATGTALTYDETTAAYNGGNLSGYIMQTSAKALFDEQDVKAITLITSMFQRHLVEICDAKGNPGSLDSAITDAFDAEFAYVTALVTPLNTSLPGATTWSTPVYEAYQELYNSGGPLSEFAVFAAKIEQYIAESLAQAKNLTQNLEPLQKLVEASITNIYIAGDLMPPFDLATRNGNAVWQDTNPTHWFVSQDGLLPIQANIGYHSARMQPNADGEDEPVSTREFYIGPAIGCPELLKIGDQLIIKISPYANGRATYQQADSIEHQIVRADPVQLGGGQIGDDTITFTVQGSVVGPLAPYALVTTAPAAYSDGGLEFEIATGALPLAPGDRWEFSAEGGEARYRIDGGSWTTIDIAGTVALTAGLSAVFRAGATPSFVAGDTYQLAALASNGAGRLRRPDDQALTWIGALQLDITPADDDTADTLLIGRHTIPSTATITLSGSNDNWSTTAYSASVPWSAGSIGLLFASTTCAKWRLAVSAAGSIDWLYLGVPSRPLYQGTALANCGQWERRMRLANGTRSRGVGGRITHENCDYDSIMSLIDGIEHAHSYDDGRIGVVSPEGEAGICTVPADIDLPDTFGHQPATAARRLSIALDLTAI